MKKYETKYFVVFNNAQAEPIEEKLNEFLNQRAADGWELLTITNSIEVLKEPVTIDEKQYTHRVQVFTVWEKTEKPETKKRTKKASA
jgi:hypothetical protein